MNSKSLVSPEPFSMAPLLSLLPVGPEQFDPEFYRPVFFSRLELIPGLIEKARIASDRATELSLTQEAAMLRQLLEWSSSV